MIANIQKTKHKKESNKMVKKANTTSEVIQAPRAQTNSMQKRSFFESDTLEGAMKVAELLSKSSFVPKEYRGEENQPNIIVALDMAMRIGASPLAVMQNMHVIQGRPSWSSPFIIATINSCGRFTPIKFRLHAGPDKDELMVYEYSWKDNQGVKKTGKKEVTIRNISCVAYATDIDSGELLEGTKIDMKMVVAEGWYTKAGSKWPTMGGHMIRYRSAAFFGRLYCPEMLMGMQAQDEVRDVVYNDKGGDVIEVQTIVQDVTDVEVQSDAQETVDELNEDIFANDVNQETPEQREEAVEDGSNAETTNA